MGLVRYPAMPASCAALACPRFPTDVINTRRSDLRVGSACTARANSKPQDRQRDPRDRRDRSQHLDDDIGRVPERREPPDEHAERQSHGRCEERPDQDTCEARAGVHEDLSAAHEIEVDGHDAERRREQEVRARNVRRCGLPDNEQAHEGNRADDPGVQAGPSGVVGERRRAGRRRFRRPQILPPRDRH